MTLDVFEAARDAPDQPALIVGERAFTYRQLAKRVARRLGSCGGGLSPGVAITLVGRSDLPTLETVYAAVSRAVPLFLAHPRLTRFELDKLLALPGVPRLFDPIPTPSGAASPNLIAAAPHPGDETILAVLFTSGTESAPKGALLSRRAFLASAEASALNLGWEPDDRWLLGLPIAHVGGLSILIRCLLARRTVVVPTDLAAGKRLSPEALSAVLHSARISLLSLVPTQLQMLLDRGLAPPPSLRAVLLGGAHTPPRTLQRANEAGWPVLTTYGLTEACSQVATQPYGTRNDGSLGSGRIIAGTEVRSVRGILHVRGPTLLSGYHGDECSPLDADGWFATGDHGQIDVNGYLHVLGRRTDLIVTGGENVYPAEVEQVLEEHPSVEAACVFGVADDTWGQIVAAALVCHEDCDLSELRAHVGLRLARHKRPRRIAFVDALPTTAAGKLDRRAVAQTAAPLLSELSP